MKFLKDRLRGVALGESGLSLIEVMVAMFIFAMVAMGVAYSLVSVLKLTNEARSKQTAANLAAAEIDADRASSDIVDLGPHTTTTTVDGTVYTIAVTTGWITSTGDAEGNGQCSSGSGALLDKRVNVDVTWPGMNPDAQPVHADTVVAPDSRVNDVDKGAIIAAVTDESGGYGGVTITVTPAPTNPNGAKAVTSTIQPTDSDGCTTILQVVPGNYVVSASKPSSVDITQSPSPSVAVTVTAGGSSPAPFQYDLAGSFSAEYHDNYTTGTVTMPTNMDTSFVNTYGIYTSTSSGPFALYPFTAGYTVLAGALAVSGSTTASCNSVDPAAWAPSADGTLVGTRPAAIAAAPGQPAQNVAEVPMGVFSVSGLAGKYLKAVAQTTGPAGTADPGCSMPSTYVVKLPNTSTATVALPFGSWVFTSGNSGSQTTAVGAAAVAPLTLGSEATVAGENVLTLDPRTAPTP